MKQIVFLGSSVTYGSASGGYSMCEYVNEVTGHTVYKWAVSGTTLVDTDESSYLSRMRKEITGRDRCDLFICQLSTNDASQNLPLGVIAPSKEAADFDTATVLGAIEAIIALAKSKWNCPIAFYTGTKYDSAAYQRMVEALYRIAKKWDIAVIDLWNDPKMNAVSKADYKRYMSDPIHPTLIGYREWWGEKFTDFVNKII